MVELSDAHIPYERERYVQEIEKQRQAANLEQRLKDSLKD
jgi:hypothetical protein